MPIGKIANKPKQNERNNNANLSLEDQIAGRAHELWLQRGRAHGSDLDDWLQAEREVNEWHHKRMQGNPSLDARRCDAGVQGRGKILT